MTLVILDGHAVNPGDLSWERFNRFASSVAVYDRTPPDLVVERIGGAELVLLNKVNMTAEIFSRCPSIKYIGLFATGYNVVDLDAARAAGVTVTNIPSYSTDAVAQHVFAFILNFTNSVARYGRDVMAGEWTRSPDFCYWDTPLMELRGKTLGVFGFGSIGRRVAQIGEAFGMSVIFCARRQREGARNQVSAEELFRRSDFLSLHAPLTAETRHVVNEKTLSLMKPSALLINTARGALVDESAVRRALDGERIAGYSCDVAETEPMAADCPLLGAPNCVVTPHIAWAPKETRARLLGAAEKNLEMFLAGAPQNVVS